jgi:uncharacterized protein YndB with AHSA1/START domain
MTGLIATATTNIDADPSTVWQAITDPAQIKHYMFGSQVVTDWRPGSSIVWKGEYDGKKYEDHGKVLEFEPGKHVTVTHFSPLSGQEDRPENYHTVTYHLAASSKGTQVTLSQDNNNSEDEKTHSQQNWQMMLDGLKKFVESK